MEHLRHFGLTRDPFANDPLVQLYFASAEHASAERQLLRGVSQAKGLCVLTGGEGTGKTMVVRHLLEDLEEDVYEACLLVPVPGVSDGDWVLARFARQMGVEEPSGDRSELLGQLYEQLAIVREDGRHSVLIIDEAQVLVEKDALRGLRGLLNLEYEDRRLLTLVLVGLPSLEDAVAADPALAHRVDINCRIGAMDDQAAVQYVTHRIVAVDGNAAILESGAIDALIRHGSGAPRRLNTLADNALFEAYVAGRPAANAEDVERAAAQLRFGEAPQLELEPVAASAAPAPVSPPMEAFVPAAPEPAVAAPAPTAAKPVQEPVAPVPAAEATLFADETVPFQQPLVTAAPAQPSPNPRDSLAAALNSFEVPEEVATVAAPAPPAPRVGVPMSKGAPGVTRFVLEADETVVGFGDFEDVVEGPAPTPAQPAAPAQPVSAAPAQPVAAAPAQRVAPQPSAPPPQPVAAQAAAPRPAPAQAPAPRPAAPAPGPVARPAAPAQPAPQAAPAAAPVAVPTAGPPKDEDDLDDVFVDLV